MNMRGASCSTRSTTAVSFLPTCAPWVQRCLRFTDQALTNRNQEPEPGLNPRIIRAPIHNCFLDIGGAELFVESALYQRRQFLVRSKAQAHELCVRKLTNT